MFSEELLELDRNTVEFMIEDMRRQIEEKDEQIKQLDEQIKQKDEQLRQLDEQIKVSEQRPFQVLCKLKKTDIRFY